MAAILFIRVSYNGMKRSTRSFDDIIIGILVRSLAVRRRRGIRDVGTLLPVVRGAGFRHGYHESRRSCKHSGLSSTDYVKAPRETRWKEKSSQLPITESL